MSSLLCSACGAPISIHNPATVSIACPYCDCVMIRSDKGLEERGNQSRLPEGYSRLYRGAVGTIGDQRFQVLGRVRYSFGKGFWDEWYVMLENGEGYWITEDDYSFSFQVLYRGSIEALPYDQYSVGDNIELGERSYQVKEVGNAECLGIEGEVPKGILPYEQYPYVDAVSYDGTHVLGLEYDNDQDPPTAFVGRWLVPSDIRLEDEELEW